MTTNIFVDEESRIQTTIKFDGPHMITAMFARTVRQSQNANFVGFYIVSGAYDVRHVSYRYLSYTEGLTFQEKWKKNKSAVLPNMLNFDEFYIGGHKHIVNDVTKAALIAGGIGVTEANFTAV